MLPSCVTWQVNLPRDFHSFGDRLRLGGLHALGDGGAVCLPGHRQTAGVEVTDEAHQGGLVGAELLIGGREECD